MAKKQKKFKPKARLPRGFGDRSSADIKATDIMLAKIRQVYELYGFDPVETPFFEYSDAMGKFLPDTDRPNAGVFSLQDDDEQWMSLRYDLTAPLARHVAQNINQITMPYRTYRQGWVFRNEKPGPGRFRQFMQFDADIVGAPGVAADAEMAMMMADTMEALGIKRGDYVIRVNNRKVLDGVLEAIGVTEEAQKLSVLRAIDKFDKFGEEGVRLLLGKGRKDESGDFTEGAGLDDRFIGLIILMISATSVTELWKVLNQFTSITGGVTNEMGTEGFLPYDDGLYEIIEQLQKLFDAAGYNSDRIRFDPSCVRGLEYYTGMVYEAELTFDVTNEKGQKVQFGSVGGGGRYDGLIERFTGQKVPATGFSIGVSRLMTALKNLDKLDDGQIPGPVVVCVMDRDQIGEYQKMVAELRDAGIRAEMYQGNPKNFGKQLQYADRRNSPAAIIQGSDEREKGIVQIKDLHEGKKAAAAIADNETWKSERPGQFEVKRDQLVNEIKKLPAVNNWLEGNKV
ncbi:MAG: histidine--tRNA ligase [Devosiaceae bacterium]|nr:histidine--tRNA ligase [Devosiaceae bacterium]